jgi:hypothetical protein
VALTKAKLDEIEEVPAEEIASDVRRAEAHVEIEGAKSGMFEPDPVERGTDRAPSGGFEGLLGSAQGIDTDRLGEPSIKQRALRSRIEEGVHIHSPRWVIWRG